MVTELRALVGDNEDFRYLMGISTADTDSDVGDNDFQY
jgi:hypothetical protein